MLCIYMMCALGIPFILEQPGSSVMEHHPCFKFVTKKYKIFKVARNYRDTYTMVSLLLPVSPFHHLKVFKAFVWMGAYGGESG